MIVAYERWLCKEDGEKLEAYGWLLGKEGCNPKDFPEFIRGFVDPGHLFGGVYAHLAIKDFPSPVNAMEEIEYLLKVDVVDDVGHDGDCPHCFFWEENGERKYASGWDCARVMFEGTPKTPRKCAQELANMKKAELAQAASELDEEGFLGGSDS